MQEVCYAIGLTIMPVSPNWSDADYKYVLNKLKPKWLFVDETIRPRICKLIEGVVSMKCIISLSPNESSDQSIWSWISNINVPILEIWLPKRKRICLTSGSTGMPKFIFKGVQNHPVSTIAMMKHFQVVHSEEQRHLVTVPLYYSAPLAFMNMSLAAGSSILVSKSPMRVANIFDCLLKFKCTTTFMPPTLLQGLLQIIENQPNFNISSLKYLWIGGMPCATHIKLSALKFNIPLHEFYGSTELGFTTIAYPEDIQKVPDSCGRPIEGVEIKIVDDSGHRVQFREIGVVMISSKNTPFDRCIDGDDIIECSEWMTVGDVGYIDEQGYLYLVDRRLDVVNLGGVKIHTYNIEHILLDHPSIQDVAAFGLPDPVYGQSLHAAIELRPNAYPLTILDIIRCMSPYMSSHKIPRSLSYHDRLPRSEIGKLNKRQIREMIMRKSKL